ncbi:hypothetical protein K435DRAFT_597020, partial [Dendrothele bispora CBS 962.96]
LVDALTEWKQNGKQAQNGWPQDAWNSCAKRMVAEFDSPKTAKQCSEHWSTKHPNDKHWRTESFPLYNEIFNLVDGLIANGKGAFHAGGQQASASCPLKTRRSTDAVDNVAAAIRDLGASFQVTPASIMAATTPERRQAAIELMEEDGDLSDDDQVAVLELFAESKSVADTYLSTKKKSIRTKYLSKQL